MRFSKWVHLPHPNRGKHDKSLSCHHLDHLDESLSTSYPPWRTPKKMGLPKKGTESSSSLKFHGNKIAVRTLHKKSTKNLYVGNRNYIAFRKSCQSFTCEVLGKFSYNSWTWTKGIFWWGGAPYNSPPFGGIHPHLAKNWSLYKIKKLPQLDQLDMLGIQAVLFSINNTGRKKQNDIGIYWSKNRDRDSPFILNHHSCFLSFFWRPWNMGRTWSHGCSGAILSLPPQGATAHGYPGKIRVPKSPRLPLWATEAAQKKSIVKNPTINPPELII